MIHQAGFDTEGNRDGHVEGWNSSFDRLAELAGSMTATVLNGTGGAQVD